MTVQLFQGVGMPCAMPTYRSEAKVALFQIRASPDNSGCVPLAVVLTIGRAPTNTQRLVRVRVSRSKVLTCKPLPACLTAASSVAAVDSRNDAGTTLVSTSNRLRRFPRRAESSGVASILALKKAASHQQNKVAIVMSEEAETAWVAKMQRRR